MHERNLVERRVLRSTHIPRQGAFGNSDVVLERPDQSPVAGYWHEDDVGYHQGEDTPVHLVIGPKASDEKLQQAADRLGIDVEPLRQFRDGKESSNG